MYCNCTTCNCIARTKVVAVVVEVQSEKAALSSGRWIGWMRIVGTFARSNQVRIVRWARAIEDRSIAYFVRRLLVELRSTVIYVIVRVRHSHHTRAIETMTYHGVHSGLTDPLES